MEQDWKSYQKTVAAFFRSLGLTAETDSRLQGVRTAHDVDVLVKSVHAGFDITWVVECKCWKRPISKLHIFGLRQIVIDVGADRGILLSESGFQSGAVEAASLTNIQLTSLAELKERTKKEISSIRLRELFDRVEACNECYWDISKEDRITLGLRHEVGTVGYSGAAIISYCRDVLSRALRGQYPVVSDDMLAYAQPELRRELSRPDEVVILLEKLVSELESKLPPRIASR